VQAAGSTKAFKICRNLPTKASHWPVELENFETTVFWLSIFDKDDVAQS
jgi:hypothetical protein